MASSKWKRNKSQEGGKVYRWFEKGWTIASVVEGYYPTEANMRVSGRGFDSFEIRGHKSTMLKMSDGEFIRIFEKHIKIRKDHKKKKGGKK